VHRMILPGQLLLAGRSKGTHPEVGNARAAHAECQLRTVRRISSLAVPYRRLWAAGWRGYGSCRGTQIAQFGADQEANHGHQAIDHRHLQAGHPEDCMARD
jgi:hypothetical protein